MRWSSSEFKKKCKKRISKTTVRTMLCHIGIKQEYGIHLVHDRFLIVAFGSAFLFMHGIVSHVLVPPLVDSDNTIGTTISLAGVFIGTYIAVWLHNQNHHKTAESNYFYKIEFLSVINAIVRDVLEFNTKIETIMAGKDIENAIKIERCKQEKYAYRILFSQYDTLLVSINADIPAPTNVKSDIILLIFKMRSAITVGLDDKNQKPIDFKGQIWKEQHDLFSLPYFTADRDKSVQQKLKERKDKWFKIKSH